MIVLHDRGVHAQPAKLEEIVTRAASAAGIDCRTAVLLRNGSNAMFRLPDSVVARVGRSGLRATAEREVRIARWLSDHGIAVTQPLPDVRQPTMVGDRPVTWWLALPSHRPGTPAELGAVLRAVHALPLPEFRLPVDDPFNGLDGRLNNASMLDADDRRWLTEHCRRLRDEYSRVVPFQAPQLIHGDAWQGNLAVVENEPPVLLDFEKVAIGDLAWDLVQIAVDHTDFTRIGTAAYAAFVDAYGGRDVINWPGYRCCAAIQELRWVAFMLDRAEADTQALPEIRHRIACIRGAVPKPWSWNAF